MKRALFLVVLLASAVPAMSQETYALTAGSGNVVTMSAVMTGTNGDKCVRYALPRNCAQATICAAANAPGGAACTAAQARTFGVRIFPVNFAGREEFLTWEIALPKFLELVAAQVAEDRRASCTAWLAQTLTFRQNQCTAMGLPNTCSFGCP